MRISRIALAVALTYPVVSLAQPESQAELQAWTPTADYYASSAHLRIADRASYDLGQFGTGVVVAVVDTGVSAHTDLSGRLLTGKSFVSGVTTAKDDNSHGTHVAGIIAAAADGKGMMGVAPGSTILPVKVMAANGSGSLTAVWSGVSYATSQDARIVNLSLGWSTPWYGDATNLKTAIDKGTLVVAAAGNAGGVNPLYPARYAKETWANGQIIAVGAVDHNNVIAAWSNKAGDAMNYYLVAPGTNILSTSNNGTGYVYKSGTSMAAPHVSGAAALLMGYWPKLTAKETADILLTTATDLGAKGTDAIYGRGLLNVQRALAPVGTKVLASSTSKATVLKTSTVKTTGTLYGAIKAASAKGITKSAFLDDYGRDYGFDAASNLATTGPDLSAQLAALLAETDSPTETPASSLRYMPAADFATGSVSPAVLPYLGFASGALVGDTELGGSGLRIGFASGLADSSRATQNAMTLGYTAGGWDLTAGFVLEQDGFMGAQMSDSALGLGAGSSVFASARRAWDVGYGWTANLSASYGVTTAKDTSGMVQSLSDVHGVSVNTGLSRHSAFKPGDRLSFSAGMPLKIVKGTAAVELARYDAEGEAHFHTASLDLAESAPELALGAQYRMPTGKYAHAALAIGARLNANQVAGNREQYALVGYSKQF
jgi:hypothetical protein